VPQPVPRRESSFLIQVFDQAIVGSYFSKSPSFKSLVDLTQTKQDERVALIKAAPSSSLAEMLKLQRQLFCVSHGTNVTKELITDLSPEEVEVIPVDAHPKYKEIAVNAIPPQLALEVVKDQLFRLREALQTNSISAVNISSYPPLEPAEVPEFFATDIKKLIAQYPRVLFVFAAGNKGESLDLPHLKINTSSFLWVGALKVPDNVLLIGSCERKLAKKSTFSNYGRNVQIYTSGENVNYVFPKGWAAVGEEHGTTFSAPRFFN
jgi:hypothetical protein